MQHPGWVLILLGGVLALIGVLWLVTGLSWLGNLPGDIRIEGKNFRFYVPLTTCLLLSLLATALVWLIRYLFRS